LGATGRGWCNLRESFEALARKAIRCERAVERGPGARPGLGKSKVSGAPSLPRCSTRQAQFGLSAECFAPVEREATARLKVRSGATIWESLPQCPLRFAPGTIGRNLRPRVGPGSSLTVSRKEVAKLKGSPADAGRCRALEFRHFLRVASSKKTGPCLLKSWSGGPGGFARLGSIPRSLGRGEVQRSYTGPRWRARLAPKLWKSPGKLIAVQREKTEIQKEAMEERSVPRTFPQPQQGAEANLGWFQDIGEHGPSGQQLFKKMCEEREKAKS